MFEEPLEVANTAELEQGSAGVSEAPADEAGGL